MTTDPTHPDDETPVAWVTERAPNPRNPNTVILAVDCPLCSRTHYHGGMAHDLDHGHRVAHCTDTARRGRGYLVREHPRPDPVDAMGTGSLLDLLGEEVDA